MTTSTQTDQEEENVFFFQEQSRILAALRALAGAKSNQGLLSLIEEWKEEREALSHWIRIGVLMENFPVNWRLRRCVEDPRVWKAAAIGACLEWSDLGVLLDDVQNYPAMPVWPDDKAVLRNLDTKRRRNERARRRLEEDS